MIGINEYFTKLTGFDPTIDQKRVLKSILNDDKILISAGRQSGKTITVSTATMYLAFEYNRPIRILLVSAQSSIVYWYMKGFFRQDSALERTLVSRSSQFIIPATGFSTIRKSEVFVRGISERSIRGVPADVVVIDEAALVPNESILSALGNLSGELAKFILLSTPTADKEAYFNDWLVNDKTFKIFHWSSEEVKWQTKLLMDTKREKYTPALWATDVLGRIPDDNELALSGKIFGDVIFSY